MSWATVTSKQNGVRSNRPPDTMRNPKYMSERGPHTTPRHDRYTRNYSPHTANSPATGSGSSFGRDHSYNAEKRGGYKSFTNRFGSDDTNYQTGFQNVVSYGDTQFSDSLFHKDERTAYQAPEFGLSETKEVVDTNNRYKRQDELWSGKTSPNPSAATGAKWKSRRVEEQKRQQEQEKKKRSWWYLDPQEEIQGPFNEEEMKDWFNEGFFGVDLPVRCHPDTLFVPLGDWFRQGNSAFLEEIPEEHRAKADNSNATTQPVPHSPRKTASTPVSVLNNQANSSNLAMSSLSGVIDDSSKPHGQPQAFSSRQVPRHTQFPPPTGSTLNMNAPAFNPMGGTDRYKPPPAAASNLNAKSTLPSQSNDPNLFSHYRNQERTKQEAPKPAKAKGSSYTPQHDLRQNTSSSSSTFDTGHNPLQTSAHPRPPMVSGVGNMRFGTTQQNGFITDGALGGISTNPPVSRNAFGYSGPTSGSDISRTNSGGWKEIGTISSPQSRHDSNLSSPFGSGTIGSDPYAVQIHKQHIPLSKHATEPKGNVSPWTRPAIMTPNEVKKTQSEINDQPENDSLRRPNEHAQIQRQRAPQENSRNFNWGGLNGTANNHNQRQQQQTRDKRISSNAQKPPLVNKLKGNSEGAKPRQASSSWASASNSSWDTRPPRIPQVRNPQAPTNPNSRGSPGGSNRQWNSAASKLDDTMSGSHSSKSTSANSSVLTQSIGSKNSSVNRSTSARKPLIKGDPGMSSSKRTNASSKGKNKNAETNSFGVKISPDFEEWCLKHINECAAQTGEDLDARALIHFLMTLSRKDEIREYIVNYLGDSPKVQEFADGFIQLKNFETTAGESTFQCKESKRSRRKRRRNKKGTSS